MADERMVPLFLDGQPVELAMTPHDFFTKKSMRKGEHEYQTAAEAGYTLGDRYESLELYDGPKTQRQYDSSRTAARAPKADEKPAPAEARKA